MTHGEKYEKARIKQFSDDIAGAKLPDVNALGGDKTMLDQDAAEAEESAKINKGDMLLDTYRVETDAKIGGMGTIWRVLHTGWNMELAMKRPKPGLFHTEKQKQLFIHECEAWMNLGLHPNIVSCYYVREIIGIPTIFSEWMDGGDLSEWIKDGRLYEGTEKEVLARALDICIQFARGLYYAHEQGLIHQDVKPCNLLLNKQGDAKVTDFGISQARATLTVRDEDMPNDAERVSGTGVFTLEYCSMEQLNGELLTRRTDIYSWAVSVLEMFLGERRWESGTEAGKEIERSLASKMRIPMPEALKLLLEPCLNSDPFKRPCDFGDIEKKLVSIYEAEITQEYPRELPDVAADTASALNNRALSFLDLGKPLDAEKCWELAQEKEYGYVEALYNHLLFHIKTGKMTGKQAAEKFAAITHGQYKHLMDALYAEDGLITVFATDEENASGSAEASPCECYFIYGQFEENEYIIRIIDPKAKQADLFAMDRGEWHSPSLSEWNFIELCQKIRGSTLSVSANGKLPKHLGKTTLSADECGLFLGSVAFSKDGMWALFAQGRDDSISLYNMKTNQPSHTYENILNPYAPHYERGMAFAVFYGTENIVFAMQRKGTLFAWDIEGQLLASSHISPIDVQENIPEHERWVLNPPVKITRGTPAYFVLSNLATTNTLLKNEKQFNGLFMAAQDLLAKSQLEKAASVIKECLAVPNYEQDISAIRLLQQACAALAKTELKMMLPIPVDDPISTELTQDINCSTAEEYPDNALNPLHQMALKELEAMRMVAGDDSYSKYYTGLYGPMVSADQKRVVYGTEIIEDCDSPMQAYIQTTHWHGAIIFDLISKEILFSCYDLSIRHGNPYVEDKARTSFSTDNTGERLLIATSALMLYQIPGGECKTLLTGANIWYASFMQDDRYVFCLGDNNTVWIFDSVTGKEMNHAVVTEYKVKSARLLDDNRFVLTDEDGQEHKWLFYWQYAER